MPKNPKMVRKPVIKERKSVTNRSMVESADPDAGLGDGENEEDSSNILTSRREALFQVVHRHPEPSSCSASASSSHEDEEESSSSPTKSTKSTPPAVTPRKFVTSPISTSGATNPFIVRTTSVQTGNGATHNSRSINMASDSMFLVMPSLPSSASLHHHQQSHLNKPLTSRSNSRMSLSSENINHSTSADAQQHILRGIFSYEGKTIDLELGDNSIKWKRANTAEASLELKQFYNVQPFISNNKTKSNSKSNLKTSTSDEDILMSMLDGFVLHSFETDQPNVFKHRALMFAHPHRETTRMWIERLKQKLPSQQTERQVLVLINPYAGEKRTRALLYHTLMPLFNTAQIKLTVVEFHDTLPLRHTLVMNDIMFDNFYGVVVVGGDGSVSKVINIMIELAMQRDENFNINEDSVESIKDNLKTPLCIIACGSTNLISHSIYGTTDYNTPLMHLFYGNTIRVDLSCTSTSNRLHSFGFGYSCGFGTTLARYMPRYSKLGLKKVQTAIARAVAKQKHRLIEVEIQYKRSRYYQPTEEIRCVRGCKVCQMEQKNIHVKKTFDQVEEFDPIAHSIEEIKDNLSINYNLHFNHNKSTTAKTKSSNDEWEVIQGSFIHVAFLTNAHLWDLASGGGLSKYAHLADGCMDLILVDSVSRKEFFRFIKRHTNSKNQLALPFVKSIRVKEARIKILNTGSSGRPNSIGNFTDQSYTSFSSSKEPSMQNFFFMGSGGGGGDTNHHQHHKNTSEDKQNRVITNHFGSKPPATPATARSNTASFALDQSLSDDEKSAGESDIDEVDLTTNGNNSNENNKYTSNSNVNFGAIVGPKIYHMRKDAAFMGSSLNMNSSTTSPIPKSNGSFLKKSRSIINLFRSDDAHTIDRKQQNVSRSQQVTNETSLSENRDFTEYKNTMNPNKLRNPLFTSYPGKNNFESKISFKAPSVWNCDWNLNNIPEMHLKCLKEFLPVFAWGIDPDTQFEESAAACLPGF